MMTQTARTMLLALACAGLAACASEPAVQPVPQPQPGASKTLIGLTGSKLRAAFGAPAFVRKDGIAELWRYDGASCKAFFILYKNQGALEVRDVETLPHGSGKAADPTCLDALRLSPSMPPSPPVS